MPRKKKKQSNIKRLLQLVALIAVSLFLFTVFQVLTLRFVNPPFTMGTTYDRVVQVYKGDPWEKPAWYWVSLNDMSTYLKRLSLLRKISVF